jgi:DNA-binding response OmpR family regulator
VLSGKRLLIVEEEYLIALEIQRVLESDSSWETVFARDFNDVAALARSPKKIDLAIVTPPRPQTSDQVVLAQLSASGTVIVVCSAVPERLARTELTIGEFVSKPFTEETLLAACRRAMTRRSARP